MDPIKVEQEQSYGGRIDMKSMERKFIKVYKQLSHLWNTNHPDYNNRFKRNAAYDTLLKIFRLYMPKATRFHIRQKINIFRSCYRKELRKHLASKMVTTEGQVEYNYIPTSWKFHALRFLDSENDGETDIDNSNAELESLPDYQDEEELEFIQDPETESQIDEPNTSKVHLSPIFVEEKPLTGKRESWYETNYSFNRESDISEREFNAIGANVACKLQRMNSQQRYHAELLINKVLIKGLKEKLTEETDLTDVWHVEEVEYNNKDSKADVIEKNHES